MRWLADRCRVLPVREAVVDLNRGGPFDRPLVAVTFDDGYADSYEIIAPILEECGLRGTFFITTGFVEQGKPLWYDIAADAWQRASSLHRQSLIDHFSNNRELRPQSGERPLDIGTWMTALKRTDPTMRMDLVNQAESRASGSVDIDRYRPLTRKQLLELHERGHEIASHSVTHPILPQLDQDELLVELEHSAEYLRNLTERTVEGFCYPNGDFNDQVESALKKAGYRYACTTQTGFNVPNVCLTRLARLSITMQRTLGAGCQHDAFAFRSELCRLREWWR
jgi:peptidoglycan/xylan/chitin deacetylase (PgdA/CDA1 family)